MLEDKKTDDNEEEPVLLEMPGEDAEDVSDKEPSMKENKFEDKEPILLEKIPEPKLN